MRFCFSYQMYWFTVKTWMNLTWPNVFSFYRNPFELRGWHLVWSQVSMCDAGGHPQPPLLLHQHDHPLPGARHHIHVSSPLLFHPHEGWVSALFCVFEVKNSLCFASCVSTQSKRQNWICSENTVSIRNDFESVFPECIAWRNRAAPHSWTRLE